jgi:hypothetical protein
MDSDFVDDDVDWSHDVQRPPGKPPRYVVKQKIATPKRRN